MRIAVNRFSTVLFGVAFVLATARCTSVPEDGNVATLPGIQVPEGYTVEVAADSTLVDYPMFSIVDETGRLFVFESAGNVYEESEEALQDPQFFIRLLEDEDGDGVYDKSTIFADSLSFPQGGVFYQGSLYASSAPELLKLTDTDGDGVADERETLLSGWVLNVNANSLIGPFMGPDGWLYMTSAIMGFDITTQEGEHLKGETSRIWRCRPDGSDLEWVSAGGMNNPIELVFTEAGEPIGTETYFTNPKAGQRDALVYWIEGGVYPKPNNNIERDGLTRTGELMPVVSKYSRVAPSGIGRYRSTGLGDDFKDNLFSVQFNTQRVLRHKLFRDEASFRTEDEVFFTAEDEDFHLTDVLEDADGSLLVVETGGWFIKGCPLSQVSKPELKGAIYRVRRTDAPPVDDPYGQQIEWASLSVDEALRYLGDARPFVRDRATQLLVERGSPAVASLAKQMQTADDAALRTQVVFILYRIGTPEAQAAVRKALDDPDLPVRVAAARSLGLARDAASVARLSEMVQQDEPAARRQAATALGQIGDTQAVPSLLAAAEGVSDRFIEHAVIYALITLEEPKMVAEGLQHASPEVQEAALVALDQMPTSPLHVDQVVPFLSSASEDLQRTALWVASHHPDWAGSLMAFLQPRLQQDSLSAEEQTLYGELLVAFSENEQVQKFVADQVNEAPDQLKLFLLDAMAASRAEFPERWTAQLGQQLVSAENEEVRARALDLIRLRELFSLKEQIQHVAEDQRASDELRTAAIGALVMVDSTLSESHFAYLYEQLPPDREASVRQQAATVLGEAHLSEAQLLRLVNDYLPQADALMLSRLLPAFRGVRHEEVGRALATVLANSDGLDNFSEDNLQAVFASYPAEVKPQVSQLMQKLRDARAGRLERLETLEASLTGGDIERGRALFYGKAICGTCHAVGADGGQFGPDLTSIQRDRSAHDILEAIVYPSVSFVREYETYRIRTQSDEYVGIIQEKKADAIILGTSTHTSVRIPRDEIVSTELADVSMMPQGLEQLLNDQEMADLMTFIMGQDQDPKKDASLLR